METKNETDKRETVADILAEWRDMVFRSKCPEIHPLVHGAVMRYLDRIEAALKRERVEIEAQALSIGGIVEASRHKPGNAAAMRETLVKIHDLTNSLNEECGVDPVEISDLARAAISAPARNCDRFTDAEAARQAWLDDTENWDEFGSPELELYEWLLAPAEERKGED